MLVAERERVHDDAIEEMQQLDKAARALRQGKRDEAERALAEARQRRLRNAKPVPVAVAAKLLDISAPTVRSWAAEGILHDAGVKPQAITLESMARTAALLRDLRDRGRGRDFRSALLARLDDELALDDGRLRESIGQMRRGRGDRPVVAGPDR